MGPDYYLVFRLMVRGQSELHSDREREREAVPEKTSWGETQTQTLTSDLIQEVEADWSLSPVCEWLMIRHKQVESLPSVCSNTAVILQYYCVYLWNHSSTSRTGRELQLTENRKVCDVKHEIFSYFNIRIFLKNWSGVRMKLQHFTGLFIWR